MDNSKTHATDLLESKYRAEGEDFFDDQQHDLRTLRPLAWIVIGFWAAVGLVWMIVEMRP